MSDLTLPRSARWFELTWRHKLWRLQRNQYTTTPHLTLRGVLPGTVPIWQGPNAFHFLAISANYFADALMMDRVGICIPPNIESRSPA